MICCCDVFADECMCMCGLFCMCVCLCVCVCVCVFVGCADLLSLDSMCTEERKRQGYIHELIQTEESYLEDLELALEVNQLLHQQHLWYISKCYLFGLCYIHMLIWFLFVWKFRCSTSQWQSLGGWRRLRWAWSLWTGGNWSWAVPNS